MLFFFLSGDHVSKTTLMVHEAWCTEMWVMENIQMIHVTHRNESWQT